MRQKTRHRGKDGVKRCHVCGDLRGTVNECPECGCVTCLGCYVEGEVYCECDSLAAPIAKTGPRIRRSR